MGRAAKRFLCGKAACIKTVTAATKNEYKNILAYNSNFSVVDRRKMTKIQVLFEYAQNAGDDERDENDAINEQRNLAKKLLKNLDL